MKLQFKPTEIYIQNAEKMDSKECHISVFTAKDDGELSHQLCIEIEERDNTSDDPPLIAIWINKNEAKYLSKFLSAFSNEKEIDIEAED